MLIIYLKGYGQQSSAPVTTAIIELRASKVSTLLRITLNASRIDDKISSSASALEVITSFSPLNREMNKDKTVANTRVIKSVITVIRLVNPTENDGDTNRYTKNIIMHKMMIITIRLNEWVYRQSQSQFPKIAHMIPLRAVPPVTLSTALTIASPIPAPISVMNDPMP